VFEFLDPGKKGVISAQGLRQKLGVLMPGFAPRDVTTLFANGKREISESELYSLLVDNEVTTADPVKDVFDMLSSVPLGPVGATAASSGMSSTKPATQAALRPLLVPPTSVKDSKPVGAGPRSEDELRLDLLKLKAVFEEFNLGALNVEELEIMRRVCYLN
jgi:hypothetical protein